MAQTRKDIPKQEANCLALIRLESVLIGINLAAHEFTLKYKCAPTRLAINCELRTALLRELYNEPLSAYALPVPLEEVAWFYINHFRLDYGATQWVLVGGPDPGQVCGL